MLAAVISELGEPPELREAPEPEPRAGEVLVEVECVPLNPIDVAIGAGRFYGGHPELPYVAGEEAVGRRLDTGERVWVYRRWTGTLAERVAVPEDVVAPVPEGTDPALAGACGIGGISGWLPVTWRAPVRADDRVLVLGATGTVGLVALQAAKLRGATHVVGAGRDAGRLERARALGADDTVELDGGEGLAERLREACGGDGPTYVVDALWGAPLVAAAEAAARHARIVHLGQSAGAEATLLSSVVRGKALDLHGFSTPLVPREVLRAEYRTLVEHAVRGEIVLDVERVPFDRVADAWRRQAGGSLKRKLVVEVQPA